MKFNKWTFGLAVLLVTASGVFVGCNTTQQRTAYNTIFTVEQTADTAVDGYFALVIKGTVPTNSVPIVAQRFNQLQAACTLAAAASQAGTNAIASANLTAELVDLTAFIATIEPATK